MVNISEVIPTSCRNNFTYIFLVKLFRRGAGISSFGMYRWSYYCPMHFKFSTLFRSCVVKLFRVGAIAGHQNLFWNFFMTCSECTREYAQWACSSEHVGIKKFILQECAPSIFKYVLKWVCSSEHIFFSLLSMLSNVLNFVSMLIVY